MHSYCDLEEGHPQKIMAEMSQSESMPGLSSSPSKGRPPIEKPSWSSDSSDIEEISAITSIPYNTSSPIVCSLSGSTFQSSFLSDDESKREDLLSSHSDHLEFIQPLPVLPPKYEDLPPGGCPRYPIIDVVSGNEQLPEYHPAAFKFGVCRIKQEWDSPYDISPDRSWRTVAMELNSTQLNFYTFSNRSRESLWNYCKKVSNDSHTYHEDMLIKKRYSTVVTNRSDAELYEFCEKMGMFASESLDSENDVQKHTLLYKLSNTKKDLSRNRHKLLRSYSLQYAKIGLANDYTKKSNVLRFRLEDEQFLIHFSFTEDLIEWHLAISIGKDVSLDIADRDIPKYRTVPRRRRNTICSSHPFTMDTTARRSRAQSDPGVGQNSGLYSTFRSLLTKYKSSTVDPSKKKNSSASSYQKSHTDTGPSRVFNKSGTKSASLDRRNLCESRTAGSGVCGNTVFQNLNKASEDNFQSDISAYEESRATNLVLDELLRCVVEEEGEYWNEDFDIEVTGVSDFRVVSSTTHSGSVGYNTDDQKWEPVHKTESSKRLVRNYLKCIKPLGFRDKWLNKCMVKPTRITPLISYYNNCFNSIENCEVSKCCCKNTVADSICSKVCVSAKHSCMAGSSGVMDLQVKLNKVPFHSLSEFVVGSHSLIPKSIH